MKHLLRSTARRVFNGPPKHVRTITMGMPSFSDQSERDRDDTGKPEPPLRNKVLESALTTLASLALLGLGGYGYHKYYKWLVLHKIEKSFEAGDPALQFYHKRHHIDEIEEGDVFDHQFVVRREQDEISAIVHGDRPGQYFLIIGEKGNGKKGMILNAMHTNQGEGVSIIEAHSDLELFRIRLGKALDYEFTEDFVGSLFSIKGQRDAGAILDIERAFNKLEKVAIKHKLQRGSDHRPLVLIFNNMHLIQDSPEGNALLELLQQRAESFAASGLLTFVFNSDEYWIFERLKQNGRRMELISITDLPKVEALAAFKNYRQRLYGTPPPDEDMETVWHAAGGRLTLLAKIAKSADMLSQTQALLRQEKTWVLNQSALIPDFDDDVLDDGKWQAGTFMMAQALVQEEAKDPERWRDELVSIPLFKCRQILTRADFMQRLDSLNIISVDTQCNVRADSRAMMQAFREIVAEEDFQASLDNVMDRCNAVESLHRTRELVFKGIDENEDLQKGVVKVFYEKVAKQSTDDDDDDEQSDDDNDPFVVASRRED